MKDIQNYEGLYAITSCGKVWNYKHKMFMATRINNSGYEMVNLSKDGIKKTYLIHRLVAQAYLPNPNNLPQVNHKNEVKTDNYLGNLEWIDIKSNNNYGNRINKYSQKRKTFSTKKRKVYCVEVDKVFESVSQASKELNVNPGGICNVCRGLRLTAGGYHFKYINEVCAPGANS